MAPAPTPSLPPPSPLLPSSSPPPSSYVALLGLAESFRQVNNINECVRCLKVLTVYVLEPIITYWPILLLLKSSQKACH